jgi:hypothetical protein
MSSKFRGLYFYLALAAYLLTSCDHQLGTSIQISSSDKHRGVCWVGGPYEISESEVQEIASKGVNWISQTPFGWQRAYDQPYISDNREAKTRGFDPWWGESDAGLIKTTSLAKAHGIKTILKPHIWLSDQSGKWRGEISMSTNEDWQTWFQEYEDFILHYAQLAEAHQMDMFCIGTELHQTAMLREEDWRQLIAKIRLIYSGPLTYAANFSGEYQDIQFWDALDYIGVQGYFPLTDREEPSLEELQEGWKKPMKQLGAFSEKYKKPILFTEIGYKSTKDAGISPWTWPQRLSKEERALHYSEETQALLYEAMMQEVMKAPFMAGIHLWKWFPNYQKRLETMKNRQSSTSFYDIDFTPQGKKAETVMTKWFYEFQ